MQKSVLVSLLCFVGSTVVFAAPTKRADINRMQQQSQFNNTVALSHGNSLGLAGTKNNTVAPTNAIATAVAKSKAVVAKSSSLGKVIALPPTNITFDSFTANWKAFAGADGYSVFVYEPIEVTETDEYAVLDESFNLVDVGSVIEPEWTEDFYVSLDEDYDYTLTPNWGCIECAFAQGMVSGILYSPYIDLTNDNGAFRVELQTSGDIGTVVKVISYGAENEEASDTITADNDGLLEFEFTNGCHDTFLKFVDMGNIYDSENTSLTWFDNVTVFQNLLAGDEILRLVALNDAVDAPTTSADFADMKFLYGATSLAYDVMAAVDVSDPDDPYDYSYEYSDYSDLERFELQQSAVNTISQDAKATINGATDIYSLDGRKVSVASAADLSAGIYVVRTADGFRKIAVK
jgi:hypothetical protein